MEPDVPWASPGNVLHTADRRDHAAAPARPTRQSRTNIVRASLEFLADMAQLAMPSLFMADAGGTDGVRQPRAAAAEALDSAEPGDTFGLPVAAPCCCKRRSPCAPIGTHRLVAPGFPWRGAGILPQMLGVRVQSMPAVPRKVVDETLRLAGVSPESHDAHAPGGWPADASDAPVGFVAPPIYTNRECYSPADDTEDDSNTTKTPSAAGAPDNLDGANHSSANADGVVAMAPTPTAAAASVDRLLTVNQYLLRRIRKLELTNQIIREAYAEVQEMLDAERQANATQLQALKNKHEEDLLAIVKEFDDRSHRNRRSSLQSFASSDDDGAGYGFRSDFSTTRASAAGVSASCNSSPLLGASAGSTSPPASIQRSASETTFTLASRRANVDSSRELRVEFQESSAGRPRSTASDSGSDSGTGTESESASEDDDDDDDDDYSTDSNIVFEDPDDDAIVFVADDAAPAAESDDSDADDSGNESDSEFDSDDGSDSEAAPAEGGARPTVNTAGRRFLPEDYASVDLVRAVLSRYYPQSRGLDLTADIDDIMAEGLDASAAQRGVGAGLDPEAQPAAGGSALPPTRTVQEMDDQEMDWNARLPADQRIAKFILRASSHLQQGARSRLSLGFMLHNLELLADKFASSHASILCAFVESLYQLAESAGSAGPGAERLLRPALSKRQRDEACTAQQSVLRVVKLLHTFIAEPEDQRLVLQLLEGLAEANGDTRPRKHARLLRTLYECEVVDRSALVQWFALSPVDTSPLRAARGELLRKAAAPLIAEVAREDEDRAAKSSEALDDAQQQLLAASGCSSVGSLTPCPPTPTAAGVGVLTPVSDESVARPGPAGFGQGIAGKAGGGRGAVTTSTSYVSVMCRSGSAAPGAEGHDLARMPSSDSMASVTLAAVAVPGGRGAPHASPAGHALRPTKQVSFAAV